MPQKNWGNIRGGKLQLGGGFPPFPPPLYQSLVGVDEGMERVGGGVRRSIALEECGGGALGGRALDEG